MKVKKSKEEIINLFKFKQFFKLIRKVGKTTASLTSHNDHTPAVDDRENSYDCYDS